MIVKKRIFKLRCKETGFVRKLNCKKGAEKKNVPLENNA
tara:strand:+ start:7066 stop:7182 length:117 start_codon:yes stop_codon:yes gene_type:complete